MDDNDYFDELESPNVIQSNTNTANDTDLGPASANSRFPLSDLAEERGDADERQDHEKRRDLRHDADDESDTFDASIRLESRSQPPQDAEIKIQDM